MNEKDLQRLLEAGLQGLDLSPGDPLCKAAYDEIVAARRDLIAMAAAGQGALQCLIDHGFNEGEDPRISDLAHALARPGVVECLREHRRRQEEG